MQHGHMQYLDVNFQDLLYHGTLVLGVEVPLIYSTCTSYLNFLLAFYFCMVLQGSLNGPFRYIAITTVPLYRYVYLVPAGPALQYERYL